MVDFGGPKGYHLRPRLDRVDSRIAPTDIGNGIIRENPALGFFVYKNVFSRERAAGIINELDSILDNEESPFRFHEATMNYNEHIPEVRKCDMFRFGHRVPLDKKYGQELRNLHSEIIEKLRLCLEDYCTEWNMQMEFIQRINYLRYHEGDYFSVHVDDGPMNSYIVTGLLYLNDEYEGGEVFYNRFGLKIKPEAGSILVTPANYIYEHESLPILSGKKYAMTMMCDYNDNNHR